MRAHEIEEVGRSLQGLEVPVIFLGLPNNALRTCLMGFLTANLGLHHVLAQEIAGDVLPAVYSAVEGRLMQFFAFLYLEITEMSVSLVRIDEDPVTSRRDTGHLQRPRGG
ncbi:hypothetical protein CDL15_Pgr028250 [Punica granatum]|nr:hypothetical protein CDL15_Pgr028250 [Punica granatum]